MLGEPAPAVDCDEEELSKKTRRTLAQLRSGFCTSLNDYRYRIGQSDSSICPICEWEDHIVVYLFDFSEYPTDFSPEDLWLSPVITANFLRTLLYIELPED